MPIFYQQDIDDDTKLGIWKIEEEESFFLQKVMPQRNVTHPHKNLQHLAGRYLLKYLFPGFPLDLVRIADTRKPFLEDEAYHFSISHCGDYASAIVSLTNRVGVDSELAFEKVVRIKDKFISPSELELLISVWSSKDLPGFRLSAPQVFYSTLAWSCKEAVFKWYGLGGVDFKNHMEIKSVIPIDGNKLDTIILFKKNEDLFLNLHSVFFNNLCLSYVIT